LEGLEWSFVLNVVNSSSRVVWRVKQCLDAQNVVSKRVWIGKLIWFAVLAIGSLSVKWLLWSRSRSSHLSLRPMRRVHAVGIGKPIGGFSKPGRPMSPPPGFTGVQNAQKPGGSIEQFVGSPCKTGKQPLGWYGRVDRLAQQRFGGYSRACMGVFVWLGCC